MPDKLVLTAVDRPHAPLIFFTSVPALSIGHGMVSVTVAADTHNQMRDGSVAAEHLVTAYLRMSQAGATQLRDMLSRALAMSEMPENAPKN